MNNLPVNRRPLTPAEALRRTHERMQIEHDARVWCAKFGSDSNFRNLTSAAESRRKQPKGNN